MMMVPVGYNQKFLFPTILGEDYYILVSGVDGANGGL
jgi:hypothetical protein